MLASYAIWGYAAVQPAVLGVVVAVALIAIVIGVWGTLLAPRATRRLSFPSRVFVEFALEAAAAMALRAAGQVQSAAIFGMLIVVRFGLGLASGADRDGL